MPDNFPEFYVLLQKRRLWDKFGNAFAGRVAPGATMSIASWIRVDYFPLDRPVFGYVRRTRIPVVNFSRTWEELKIYFLWKIEEKTTEKYWRHFSRYGLTFCQMSRVYLFYTKICLNQFFYTIFFFFTNFLLFYTNFFLKNLFLNFKISCKKFLM